MDTERCRGINRNARGTDLTLTLAVMDTVITMVTKCLLVHPCFADSVTDVISTDIVFYSETLSPFPSKKAVLNYSIDLQNATPDNVVSLKIYTTEDHVEFSRMCLNEKYGQLKNEKLYIPSNSFIILPERCEL